MTAGRARHLPLRRCAACRTVLPKQELIRFARDEQGEWQLDARGRAGGRGVWVCRNRDCHQKRALGRVFRSQADAVAEQLTRHSATEQRRQEAKTTQDGGIDV